MGNKMDYTPGLVSVIIPVRDRFALFAEAFNSVLAQQYEHLEVIIVDDGSTNETKEKILSLIKATKDFTIKYFETGGKGAPIARNFGYRNSTGEFIQFFDSDDLLLPEKIQQQVQILKEDKSLSLTYSKAQFIDENNKLKEAYWGRALTGESNDYFEFPYQTMCPLYRRVAIEEFGLWDESLFINQDWEFSLRYIALGAKVNFVDKVQCLYRFHTHGNIGQLQSDFKKIQSKWGSTCKIYFLLKKLGKVDGILKGLFVKRWGYILLLASAAGASSEFNKQFKEIKTELRPTEKLLLSIFKFPTLAKLILKVYTTR
jgi:glycosyltransferase involved in cell wall biosynthesis